MTPMPEAAAPDRAARGAPAARRWVQPMVARDPAEEEHRSSTPLELLFDLCFAAAVSQAATQFHHAVDDGRLLGGILGYASVFFAIWWAWVNFTWFASTYDTDDPPYRFMTLAQLAGVLVLAAGVPQAFAFDDFTLVVIGFAIMRAGLVGQWLRAAHANAAGQRTALRYAVGLTLCWAGWSVLLLAVDGPARMLLWPVLAAGELSVPLWARRTGACPWHPRHIADRYGCFSLVVLGESVLGASTAMQTALDSRGAPHALYGIAVGGILTFFSMWWLYFARPAHAFLVDSRIGFVWGYGHLAVFASVAAVGAGLSANVDLAMRHTATDARVVGACFTVPVALYLLAVWMLHLRPHRAHAAGGVVFPSAALFVAALGLTRWPVPVTGAVMVLLVCCAVSIASPAAPVRTAGS